MSKINERSHIYWCRSCDVPLLQPQCGNCGDEGFAMVSDLRPVFDEEKQLIEQLTNEDLPEQTDLLWMRNRILWYKGNRYLKFIGADTLQIATRYTVDLAKSNSNHQNHIQVLKAANLPTLKKLEDDAMKFIYEASSQFRQCVPVVSFSGGKDSVVISYLVRKALSKEPVRHIFGDTTIEFPDTYEFINSYIQDNPDIQFIWDGSGRDWFEMCDVLQPPSRITAWCCSVFKATSIAKAMQRISTNNRILCFEGVRRGESTRRRNRPAIAYKNKIAKQIIARPILNWRDIDVWIYILTNSLPINAAYRRGLNRVGCLYCPHHSQKDDWWLEKMYPEHMKKWRCYIIEYAKNKLGKSDPDEYWLSGAWKARVGHDGSGPRGQLERRSCSDDESTNFLLKRDFEASKIESYLKPFGSVIRTDLSLGTTFQVNRKGIPLFQIWGVDGLPRAKVTIFRRERYLSTMNDISRQLRKYQACVYCGFCEAVCKYCAISVKTEIKEWTIDDELCTHCMDCLDAKRIKGGCVAVNTSYGKVRNSNMYSKS